MTRTSGQPMSPGILSPAHRSLTVGIVATIAFIAFEAMAVATAMPTAVPELDGVKYYAFAFSGFFTTSLLGMVVSGELCDRRGPLLPSVVGGVTFSVGLIIAGTAQSMWPFVAGRAAQGLGGGLVIVALYVVVGRSYDESLRPRIFAAISAAWVVPSIVGPLISGLLSDHASWRWVFLGLAPFVVIPMVLILPSVRAVDGPPPSGPVVRRRRMPLAVATATGMGLLQYAGSRADLAAVGFCVIAAALLVPSVPRLLPPGTLRIRRGLPTVVLMRGILAGAFFGAEAFLPLMLVAERGLSSTLAGLSLTGGALGWAAGSWYQGRPRTVIPRHMLVQAGSAVVATAVALLMLVLLPAVPAIVAAVIWSFGAIGMGMAMSSISVLLFELSPVEEHGSNSAAMQLSDALFSIAFVGLAGVIFGSGHGTETASDVSVPTWIYIVILVVMSALAVFGAWAAGRIRPDREGARVPESSSRGNRSGPRQA
ncbi:MFS transporter [Phytoactinopolyspora halotolerans]|uniref:MFS transporter n=1 Tax=Phytoactinopolyspora halotolerans TaxID=1981512 RepID=A0A6L9SAX5_9ACTN|nr:MFS transporter [Phytoactinopolyspora halotolerans]NEE01658.1 MFS transporter [Phytoactinopolyspora halotolerans]